LPFLIGWNVLLFGVAERPDFIALDALAGKIHEHAALVFFARLSDLRQELKNSIESHVAHAGRTAK